jgi:hypothetical protein
MKQGTTKVVLSNPLFFSGSNTQLKNHNSSSNKGGKIRTITQVPIKAEKY